MIDPEQIGCEGFYAYGAGLAAGREPNEHGQEFYCNGCPLRDDCWTKHRRRVARLLPWLVATFNRFREMADTEEQAVYRFEQQFGTPDPFKAVLLGNFEDALAHGREIEPEPRASTPTLPAPPLEQELPAMPRARLYDGRVVRVEADLDLPILYLYDEGEAIEVRIEDVGEIVEERLD